MPTLTFILPDGTPRPLQFDEDDPSVMHAGVRANLPNLPADCGGQLACATCMVDVAPAWQAQVGPPGPDEADMLSDTLGEVPVGRRLCCQIPLDATLDGLVVTLPAKQG
jgi:2Fe-2S ferredoxin